MGNRSRSIVTRSGLEPDFEGQLPFKCTTLDVEAYLQKKIDVAVELAKEKNPDLSDIDIRLTTTTLFGKDFLPFLLMLPTSALIDYERKRKKKVEGELSIFNQQDDARRSTLRPEIFNAIKPFKYTNEDKEFFRGNNNRYVKYDHRKVPSLISFMDPKTIGLGRGKNKRSQVVVLIDPVRIFFDMVKDVDYPDDNFDIEISMKATKRLKSGIYEYKFIRDADFNRKKNKKHNRSNQSLNEELEAALDNRRYR